MSCATEAAKRHLSKDAAPGRIVSNKRATSPGCIPALVHVGLQQDDYETLTPGALPSRPHMGEPRSPGQGTRRTAESEHLRGSVG